MRNNLPPVELINQLRNLHPNKVVHNAKYFSTGATNLRKHETTLLFLISNSNFIVRFNHRYR